LRFPTREDIISLNRRHLEISGEDFYEPDNLLSPGSLEWVLEAIQYPLFGEIHHAGLADKAATLAWTIIAGHIFWDGNKRTGMAALETFLRWNGYQLETTDEEIKQVAIRIADATQSNYTREEFTEWLRGKVVLKV
jgi:death-on-curing protein